MELGKQEEEEVVAELVGTVEVRVEVVVAVGWVDTAAVAEVAAELAGIGAMSKLEAAA